MNAADYIDWNRERPRLEREVLARDFPGETWGNVSEANQAAYDQKVQEAVDAFEASFLAERAPALLQESERVLRAWELLDAGFVELATDRKRLRLHARLRPDYGTE